MMIEQLRQCVEKLQATSGRLDKENILKEYKDNEFVKKCLWYRFNKYIVFRRDLHHRENNTDSKTYYYCGKGYNKGNSETLKEKASDLVYVI